MSHHGEYVSPAATAHDTIDKGETPSLAAGASNRRLPPHVNSIFSPSRNGKSAIPVRVNAGSMERMTPDKMRLHNGSDRGDSNSNNRQEYGSEGNNDDRFRSGRPSRGASVADRLGGYRSLDRQLDDYSLDFDKLSTVQFAVDHSDEDSISLSDMRALLEEKTLSDVGGPEDFTVNMDKYLFGEARRAGRRHIPVIPAAKEDVEREEHVGDEGREDGQDKNGMGAVPDEGGPELSEESDFEPPVDVSTPSQIVRTNDGPAVKGGVQPEETELGSTVMMSNERHGRFSNSTGLDRVNDDMRRQIVELENSVKRKDEQLEMIRASQTTKQIEHLQTELQHTMDELKAKHNSDASLREQVELLRKQCEEKDSILQKSSPATSDVSVLKGQLSVLQNQISDVQQRLESQHESVQKQLQNQLASFDLDEKTVAAITPLCRQLDSVQDQLRRRDWMSEETSAKLRDAISAKDVLLHQQQSDIDDLKTQNEAQLLDIERLGTDVEQSSADYKDLENRFLLLEKETRPLEERNHSLEAEMKVQQNALNAVAEDLPIQRTGGNTYSEILDLIRDLWQSGAVQHPEPPIPAQTSQSNEIELGQSKQEITQLTEELEKANVAKRDADAELSGAKQRITSLEELLNTITAENTQTTNATDELGSETDDFDVEHSNGLDTLYEQEEEEEEEERQKMPSEPQHHAHEVNSNTRKSEIEHSDTLDRLFGQKEEEKENQSPPRASQQATAAQEETHHIELENLQNRHVAELSTLRASHADLVNKLDEQLLTAEERGRILESELQELRSSIAAQERKQNEETKRLQNLVTIKDEAAAAVDERIARSLEKREAEWQRRVDSLLRDRERMGKALMLSWAEKEAREQGKKLGGEGDGGIPYRYKYAHPVKKERRGNRENREILQME